MKTIEEIAIQVKAIANTIGFTTGNISVSNTDYGTSCYFNIYSDLLLAERVKVRISDHDATNPVRMATEIMIGRFTTLEAINELFLPYEQAIFPSRFESVNFSTSFSRQMEINAISVLDSDQIISSRIAKSGKLHHTINRIEVIEGVKKIRVAA